MKNVTVIAIIALFPSLATCFAPSRTIEAAFHFKPSSAAVDAKTTRSLSHLGPSIKQLDKQDIPSTTLTDPEVLIPMATLMTALPAEAAGVVPSALWAYGHYLSIIVITGCLVAERNIVKPGMSVEDEDFIVKIDVVYGVMAALLIISGFARAAKFGQGGDYYIHEILFWVKMAFSGVWGGLSIFPSLTFYQRNFKRKNNEQVPPLSPKLAARVTQIINAEISAILTIPFLATLMTRGVWYWQDFYWQVGLALAIAATGGSFFYYGRQALTWTEDDEAVAIAAKEE